MSKRHLEPDGTVVSRETTPAALGRCRDPNMTSREETLLNGCSSIQWRTDGPSCTSPQGGGNLKRPRAFALQRFDFSLLKDESTGSTAKVPSASTSVGASTTQCSTLSTSTAAPHQAGPGVVMTTTSAAPTMILPFLFLGSQNDALSKEFITGNKITHVLNASATCPKSPFVLNENFLRIPVNDSHTERLLPYFEDVANFLDGCCKSNGRALVHCLAGISRSPTFVIAYVMRHLRLPQDEAYRFVKMRRLSISPNFNFLGQLLEFESILQQSSSAPASAASHLSSITSRTSTIVHQASPRKPATVAASLHAPLGARSRMVSFAQSPTTALAKLSFEKLSPTSEDEKRVVSETKPVVKLPVHSDKTPKSVDRNKVLDKRFHEAQKYLGDSKSRSAINSEPSNEISNNQSSISRHLAMQDKFLLKPQTAASPVKLTNPLVAELAAGNVRKRGNTGSPTNSRRVSPPTRPSSIAISSLQFDFSVLKTDLPLEFKGILPDSSSPYSVLSCMADSRSRLPMACSRDLLEQVESACRSRSFSDIPAMTSTRPLPCGVIGDAIPGDGSAIATRAWHSALEARASNGSLSSVSSHGSLHGSREMVQVS